jgi:hypothetical protein
VRASAPVLEHVVVTQLGEPSVHRQVGPVHGCLDQIHLGRRRIHVVTSAGSTVAGAQLHLDRRQSLSQVDRVVRPPAMLVGFEVSPDPSGGTTVPLRHRVREGTQVGIQDVQRARERRGEAEQIGMARGVRQRAEAAHRQPGDGASAPVGAHRQRRLDPVPQLGQVEAGPQLPAECGVGPRPVAVPTPSAAVGHDDHERQILRQPLGVAGRGPTTVVVVTPVQQPQHGERPRSRFGGWGQHSDVGRRRQGGAVQRVVDQARGESGGGELHRFGHGETVATSPVDRADAPVHARLMGP